MCGNFKKELLFIEKGGHLAFSPWIYYSKRLIRLNYLLLL